MGEDSEADDETARKRSGRWARSAENMMKLQEEVEDGRRQRRR